ncbi:MAG TPA: thiamine-phosphate kinase [Candidatus Acidoferrales bacterium]|nr:thiamine-phosphate kinase [Candidatus Acidoferrales bacterium]
MSPISTGLKDRENTLIKRLTRAVPSILERHGQSGIPLGIGDDAAVLRPSGKTDWVLSCDSSLEGIHFLDSVHPPESIGYKSLARAVSDLAAMGARPRYFLLALALPSQKTHDWLARFARGMARAARESRIRLVGGDISKTQRVAISITVLGEIAHGKAVTRAGARPGDLLYVSGRLGAAQLGLEIVLRGLSRRPSLKKHLRPHFYPRIPLDLAESLARDSIPSAMMDISDGLSTDLARLCAASGVGARLWAPQIPTVRVPQLLKRTSLTPLELALHGGDDYGLLFTVPPKSLSRLRRLAAMQQITKIGEVTRDTKLRLIRADGTQSLLEPGGWQPF